MPVEATAENEVTLPTGGTVRLPDSAIRRDLKVSVTCEQCGKVISWSQLDVATDPNALPESAKSIVKVGAFDGKEQVYCEMSCLISKVQEEQAKVQAQAHALTLQIHRVK